MTWGLDVVLRPQMGKMSGFDVHMKSQTAYRVRHTWLSPNPRLDDKIHDSNVACVLMTLPSLSFLWGFFTKQQK